MAAPNSSSMDAEAVHYFAYGSMCNVVSLKRRNVFPKASQPAVLPHYEIRFELAGGMANIVKSPGNAVHGVLHMITPAEFQTLAKVEAIYGWTPLECLPYRPIAPTGTGTGSSKLELLADQEQGELREQSKGVQFTHGVHHLQLLPAVLARCFIISQGQMQQLPQQPLPSERYLKIILQGQHHHGICSMWLDQLRRQAFQPGRLPHHWLKAPVMGDPACLPTMTQQWLAEQRHAAAGTCITGVGRKVLQIDVTDSTPSNFKEIMDIYYAGREISFTMVMYLYEPSLPEVTCRADMTAQHLAWAEDYVVGSLLEGSCSVRQIAWLQQEQEQQQGQQG